MKVDDDIRAGAKLPDCVLKKLSEGKLLTCELKNPEHVLLHQPSAPDLDSARFAQVWNTGWRGRTDLSGRVFLNFRLSSRADVDARYAALRDAGYRGLQPPTDAFWGARFAAIEDPQGVGVGLQSPPDDALRSAPPNF